MGGVRLGTGGAEGAFQVCPGLAGGDGAFFEFLKLKLLLGDAVVDLIERFVGGGEIEFLLGELFAGRGNVRVVLRNAAFALSLTLVVESDARFG